MLKEDRFILRMISRNAYQEMNVFVVKLHCGSRDGSTFAGRRAGIPLASPEAVTMTRCFLQWHSLALGTKNYGWQTGSSRYNRSSEIASDL